MSSIRKAESDAVAKKIAIATATQTIKTCTLRQGMITVAQIGVQYTLGDGIQKEIERKVEQTIANTLAASHTIQRAIAAYIKHTRNGLQGKIISRGSPLLNEKTSEFGNFLTNVAKGVLSKEVRFVAEFFQIKSAVSAVDDLLNCSRRFAEELIRVVERDETPEIQK